MKIFPKPCSHILYGNNMYKNPMITSHSQTMNVDVKLLSPLPLYQPPLLWEGYMTWLCAQGQAHAVKGKNLPYTVATRLETSLYAVALTVPPWSHLNSIILNVNSCLWPYSV